MIKVFLSHSSKQKDTVLEVSKKLGLNFSIIDKYTFEDGSDLQDEINTAIHSSKIFALFLSKEAFESDWVRKELKEVRDLVDENQIGFCAFIIERFGFPMGNELYTPCTGINNHNGSQPTS